tara:strand:+ start:248 stop:472 length:225 start_codon:yes stop_codon:yes gene_type:complete
MLSSRYVKLFLPRNITSSYRLRASWGIITDRLRASWGIITEPILKSSRVLMLLNSLMKNYQEVPDWICLPCIYE